MKKLIETIREFFRPKWYLVLPDETTGEILYWNGTPVKDPDKKKLYRTYFFARLNRNDFADWLMIPDDEFLILYHIKE